MVMGVGYDMEIEGVISLFFRDDGVKRHQER